MLSRRATGVTSAMQWLVGARSATTVAARVKSGTAAAKSASHVVTATRVGELVRLAAERYDYNDMVVSTPQNIKFTFTLSQVRKRLVFYVFFFFFFFFF
jgi:hypothetical protein